MKRKTRGTEIECQMCTEERDASVDALKAIEDAFCSGAKRKGGE